MLNHMTINLFSKNSIPARDLLDWEVISRSITDFCYFESNKKKIVLPSPNIDVSFIESEFDKISIYSKFLNEEQIYFLKNLFILLKADESIQDIINYLKKDRILSMSDMNQLVLVTEVIFKIHDAFKNAEITEMTNIKLLDFQHFKKLFLREFRYLVDEKGNVNFDRHPQLLAINKKIIDIEEKIRFHIAEVSKSSQFSGKLQFESFDILNERYCIPVKSDSFQGSMGSIVAKSESGHTLFVEPFVLRPYNQKRLDLLSQREEIINQLTLQFTKKLRPYSSLIFESFNIIKNIDFYMGKTSFCHHWKLERPIIKKSPGFKFYKLFHPLISNPVSNDIHCHMDHLGIVISGPNTGGKTVFLKSIAISYLLFSHGFYVPAQEAELFPYQSLFYFGNDLQNLSSGLSSFSGEAKNYINLLSQLHESNLVLIDEIFNSTSSDEASALSLAYFEKLHQKAGCHIIVSTHHQMFKTLIHQNKSYLSCHVGFDKNELRPTYKINVGTPGPSMAIEIFKILSQENHEALEIGNQAIHYLDNKNISYESLLQEVTDRKIELDKLIRSTENLQQELQNKKGSMEGILHLKIQEELKKAQREIEKIINKAQNVLKETQESKITKPKKIEIHASMIRSDLRSLFPHDSEQRDDNHAHHYTSLNLDQLKVGDKVFSLKLKKEFTVKSIHLRSKSLIISKGPISLNVKAHEVTHAQSSEQQPQEVSVSIHKSRSPSFEVDGRGLRLSDFQNKVENSLGDLLTGDIPFLTIIHGHGDGILKKWVRNYIKRSKDFTFEPSELGNDGETRVVLKT